MERINYYNAMKAFLLNSKYNVTEDLLNYILSRVKANKKEINEIIRINKENVSYEEIENVIMDEISNSENCKNYKDLIISNNFLSVQILMPIGVIAIEVFEIIEIIRYLIRAIKSRNAIVISDVEYNELSTKYLIYNIIKEALRKFEINEDLIDILPFDECYYSKFDRVIYTYNEYGEKLDKYKYDFLDYSNKNYIYIEDEELKENAIKDNESKEYELLTGEMDEVISKINEAKGNCAIIYTSNPEKAYKFINLVNAKNVFVNASLENVKECEKSENELYEYKNIIIPIPHNKIDEIENEDALERNKNNEIENMSLENAEKVDVKQDSTNQDNKNQETALAEIKGGIFERIKRLLYRLFRK